MDDTFRDLLAAADPMLRALAGAGPLESLARELRELLENAQQGSRVGKRRQEFMASVGKNDQVWVPKAGQVCRIARINRKEQTLSVQVGRLTMELTFDDVSFLDPEQMVAFMEQIQGPPGNS